MTITNKITNIALEEKEIEALVTILEEITIIRAEHYKNIGDGVKPAKPAAFEKYDTARELRNQFGAIIGKHYLGADC